MVRLDGEIDLALLRQSIQIVLARHEALNLRFSPDGDYQQKTTSTPIEIPLIDLSDLDVAVLETRLGEEFVEIGSTEFDLASGPLVRIQILRVAESSHTLLFSCHHIVCDGWSWNLMLKEMGQIYSALCEGRAYRLAKTFSYSNFVVTEIQRQTSEAVTKSYTYWLDQFAELPPALELPTDRPRPNVKTFSGGTVTHYFDTSLYESIKKTAAAQRASLFSMLFAGFNLLLARLSGQDDVVMTVPSAGQLNIGQTNLVGHCVNLLPVRTRLDMQSKFSDYLAATTTNILDAYDHHDATLGGIVNRLDMPRNASRIPLAEVNFNVDRDDAGVAFGDAEVHIAQTPKEAVVFDIFFNINETREGLKVDCDFNTDLYDHATIERWIGYFETLLASIAENPDAVLTQLAFLPVAERQTLLTNWNQTTTTYPTDKGIHDLFAEQAARTPDAVAVVDAHTQFTYRELDERTNQLANYLREQGVGREEFVGLYVDRTAEMLVGLLGILKAGGAYIPLDPDYPVDRISYMIGDSGLRVIVTQRELQAELATEIADEAITTVLLDDDWATIAAQPLTAPTVRIESEQLAYVIYTSGSTGNPKGVQIPHQALTNFLISMLGEPGINENDVLAAVTTISFDIAALELYLPLITGAQVVIVPRETAVDGYQLAKLLRAHSATIMQATPTTWHLLLESGWQNETGLKMLCGGEAIPPELAQQLLAHGGGELWNMYGPTETTIWSSVQKLDPTDEQITIGRPIANTQIYILDQSLQPVPLGAVGDLYIGGDGMARGYLNRAALTDERFISNPFSNNSSNNDSSSRIYNTGDLARYLPDGRIVCLGRNDSQVKVRGYRIELGEIESTLGHHPAITRCAVIVREDTPGNKQLAAYYVSDGETAPSWAEFRQYLGESLPEYMVPAISMQLDEMPLTPNGKINRNALPTPTDLRSGSEESYVAPSTPIEQDVAAAWQTVLGIEKISVYDNFFDLGGHSLHGTRIIARLRNELNIELGMRTLFSAPTISGFAAAVTEQIAADQDDGELEEMLSEIENLSESELQALLDD